MDAAHPAEVTLTVSEAAAATGLSPKAIRRRIERGSLSAVLRDGRRRIALDDLLRAGLLVEPPRHPAAAPRRLDASEVAVEEPEAGAVIRELLDRIERQSSELARLRLIAAHAERARVAEVERLRRELQAARAAAHHG